MSTTPKFLIRTVVVQGNTYIRVEDVAEYIRECGSGEETDVRNRLKHAAENLVNQTRDSGT